MVSKEVIKPATIDGERLLKVLADHTWILNVPGWPALSNPRIPANRISPSAFMPEDKIPPVPPHSRIRIPMKSPLFGRPLGHVKSIDPSKSRELQRVEVDISTMPICGLPVEEMPYNLHGLVNGLRRFGKVIRYLHPQEVHFPYEFFDISPRKIYQAHFPLFSLCDRLVLDIGEIHPPLHRIA